MKNFRITWLRRALVSLLVMAMLLSTGAFAAFADVPEDSELGAAVAWAFENGVARGTGDGRFEPDAPCTKAALVTFLWRYADAPDMGEDTTWWSDAAAWAVQKGILTSADGMEQPVSGAEFAALITLLGGSADASGAVVTRGEAITALYHVANAEPTLSDGKPWVDYCLRENAATAVKPATGKDDFYLYTNYDWMRTAEIKPGYSSVTPFFDAAFETQEMGKSVLSDSSLTSDSAKMAQHLYSAFLDWDARNALGAAPMQKVVDRIQAVSTLDELTALLSDPTIQSERFFGPAVYTGLNDSETNILWIVPMGLLLGDSAEYAQRTEMGDRCEAAYRAAAAKLFPKFGFSASEAEKMMDKALALEAELAPGLMTSAERMAPDFFQRVNNEMDRAGAEKLAGAFPWLKITDALGYSGAQRYLIMQPEFFKTLDAVYTAERLDDLKNYVLISTMLSNMSDLDRECYEISAETNNALNGITGFQSDEDAAFGVVRGKLTTPMDRAFLEKYDASKMKADITRICKEAIAYYRTMLQGEDWLSETTRQKAIEKLDAITINAVYPDKWRDYSGLKLDGLGYYDCIQAIHAFDTAYAQSCLNKKVDHELWDFDILEANAYYDPQSNSISIIRGLLGSAFYRDDMSDEELYAGIGSVIGHEISHAFDTNGAQFDAQGNMANWWTEDDYAAFTARAKKLADYYSAMTAYGGYHVQGQNIQTEAIADMAGIKCMLGILEQKDSPDYKAFFNAYATICRRLTTKEREYYLLTQDVHPLHFLRTNATLQQFEQFYKTYDIKEGDGMYLAPESRVLVW